ncbi:MAG: triphosphoribosyl-dephospho-CoA synthase [Planctomycetota bacterium]
MAAAPTDFARHAAGALAALPPACRPWGRGWCGALAGILEAAAAKPGNVHPGASFPDLSFADLAAAAIAIAPALDAAAARPLGETVLDAVRASRSATPSNANLGIVLLLAPLAAVPDDEPPAPASLCAAVEAVLAGAGPRDAALVWEAIALARPGGLGTSDRWDVAGPPPADIRAAMRHAAPRDAIASLWAFGYEPLVAGPVADIAAGIDDGLGLEAAIVRGHLRQLARRPDSLIARRHGADVAAEVSATAADVVAAESSPAWEPAVAEFDRRLRQPRRLNPGTTADLVAAALYILLRDGRPRPALPFPTPPLPQDQASPPSPP